MQATTTWTGAHLTEWARRASPGASIEYHRGVVVSDRARDRRVDVVASAAWDLYMADVVELVQRRYGPSDYGYIAQKRRWK